MSSVAKSLLYSNNLNYIQKQQSTTIYVENLENEQNSLNYYGLGQTSLYYLWSISGQLDRESQNSTNNKTSPKRQIKSSISEYLIQKTTELDTSSSLKALFETFIHWCNYGFDQIPIHLLGVTLKSVIFLHFLFEN